MRLAPAQRECLQLRQVLADRNRDADGGGGRGVPDSGWMRYDPKANWRHAGDWAKAGVVTKNVLHTSPSTVSLVVYGLFELHARSACHA